MAKAPKALCAQCSLRDEPFVPCSGSFDAKWAIVGEAPGATEVEQGKPFVGQSGQLLDVALQWAGADPTDSFRTNVVCCRPPENRTPTESEIQCCYPRLMNELMQTQNPLLALGLVACEVLKVDFEQKGAWLQLPDGKFVKPAWHPAYVLREPSEAPIFLAEIASYVRGPEARRNFQPNHVWPQSLAELRSLLAACPDNAWVAFDIETDQVVWYSTPAKARDSILMLQIAWTVQHVIIVSDVLLYDTPGVPELLNEFFARVRAVGHNAKFDAVFLRSHIGVDPQVKFDTLLAQYILDEGMPKGLKKIVALEFGMADYEEGLIRGYLTSRNDRYSKIDPEVLATYGALDVVCTLELRKVYEARLRTLGQYETPFMDIIMPASKALEDVELRGFLVDEHAISDVSIRLQQEIEKETENVREAAGEPNLNPNSPPQLSVVFYDKLQLPQPRGRKIKKGSTNADVLEELKGTHPIIEALGRYRRVKKLYTSYVNNVIELRDLDGRVHGNFLIYGTEVGRLSVRDPALQTIARPDDEYGAMIRGMYCAAPGKRLVIADYSQAELRVMACYSQEPFLLGAYRNDRDLHTEVAKAMYGPDFTKAQRVICKMFNFSYIYGGSEYSFAESSGLPIDVARQFVREYNKNMPVALAWKKAQFERAQADGYVETIFGRRRHFPLITQSNYDDTRKACVHMVIASTASDLTLKSLIEIEKEGFPVVLSVHDSILVEVDERDAKAAGEFMRSTMIRMGDTYLPDVPWKTDVEIRQSWSGGDYWEFVNGEWEHHD